MQWDPSIKCYCEDLRSSPYIPPDQLIPPPTQNVPNSQHSEFGPTQSPSTSTQFSQHEPTLPPTCDNQWGDWEPQLIDPGIALILCQIAQCYEAYGF